MFIGRSHAFARVLREVLIDLGAEHRRLPLSGIEETLFKLLARAIQPGE
jgi:hypothetical protein